jgi:hypothetical protein
MRGWCVGVAALFAGSASGGLIAYYDFEGGSLADRSGNGVVATNSNGSFVSGLNGTALSLSGASQFVTVNLDINPATLPKLTMGAWVSSRGGSVGKVLSHDNGFFDRTLGQDTRAGTGSRWTAFNGDGVIGGTPNVIVGEAVFLAVVYDAAAGTTRLTVDGQVFASSGSQGGGFSTLRIGSNPGFGEFFNGLVDDVFFFDEALTDQQVQDIRNNGIPTPGATGVLALAGLSVLSRGRARSAR